MALLKARSAPASVSSAPASLAASMKRLDCSRSSGLGGDGLRDMGDSSNSALLNPEPLQRRAAGLIAPRFPHPIQLWALDRLVYVPESQFQEQPRGLGCDPSATELFGLVCALMGIWWRSIWAQARNRLGIGSYLSNKSVHHRNSRKF